MDGASGAEQFETVIIGGGQAGLSVGYHLARRGRRFVILDANHRIGDAWRTRWESLRLFTPARYDGLPGWPFPAPGWSFPTKDEVADYLEAYAARFELPVRTGVRVDRLFRQGERYVVAAGDRRLVADQVVVVAAGAYQRPRVPAFPLSWIRASAFCIPASIGIPPSCGRGRPGTKRRRCARTSTSRSSRPCGRCGRRGRPAGAGRGAVRRPAADPRPAGRRAPPWARRLRGSAPRDLRLASRPMRKFGPVRVSPVPRSP
jgi:hypothetical protein